MSRPDPGRVYRVHDAEAASAFGESILALASHNAGYWRRRRVIGHLVIGMMGAVHDGQPLIGDDVGDESCPKE